MTDVLKRNNVKVSGEGDQVMMFAHGFGCDQNVWRHLIQHYRDSFRIVTFDNVGAGNSDKGAYDSDKYSSLDGYADDILEILEALGADKVVFIGHSVSAMTGMKAAIKKPGYFSNLIFVAPSPCYMNDGSYRGGMDRADLEALLDMMDRNYLGWSSTLAPLIMGNEDRPELTDELRDNFCSTDPDIAKEFARVTFLSDCRASLRELKVKSLTLQCSDDMLAPLEVGYFIQEQTAGNTLTILSATGHCPHLSAPAETITAINTFIGV